MVSDILYGIGYAFMFAAMIVFLAGLPSLPILGWLINRWKGMFAVVLLVVAVTLLLGVIGLLGLLLADGL